MDLPNVLFPYSVLIGALPAILGVSTIFYVYYTTVIVHHHLPDWLWMPVISLLGCAEPESTYYQIGFTLTGLSTLLFFFTFQSSILSYIPNEFDGEKKKMKWTVLLCAAGVTGQGIITMEESAIAGITSPNEEGEIAWQPGQQSAIHQLLAAVFFMAAMYHGITAVQVYFNCEEEPIASLVKSRYCKLITLAFPICFQLMSFVYHPISGGTKTQNELNKAGLGQWMTVFSYLAFFASYSVDHLSIQSILQKAKKADQKSDKKND